MCKSKSDARASDPKPRPSPRISSAGTIPSSGRSRFPIDTPTSYYRTAAVSASSTSNPNSSSSSSRASLANLRVSLPESPGIYPFSEISSATNNFLSKRLFSSSSWRCSLRGKDAAVFQRPLDGDPLALPSRLSAVCKSHHSSLVKLLGVSLAGIHIYLVYEYVPGASLKECLRNPKNPNFTPLSKWISRMQIATDLAQGLEYIHYHSVDYPRDQRRTRGTVHNRIKSSSVIVTEPNFNAKICYFAAAELAGEVAEEEINKTAEISDDCSPKRRRSDSGRMRIEGKRGYIAPEILTGGTISKRSDVFAFGVVLLELISGKEPLKYKFDRERKDYERVSVIETAREAVGTEDEDGAWEAEAEERRGRVRRWVDGRLRDSFPVEAAERLIRVALRCVEAEPWMRPDMTWVSGKVSKLFLDSAAWGEMIRVPTDFSVSLAPR